MDLTPILGPLNDAQRAAVTASLTSNALVLAGAGSGKTRVLVHRIAYLLEAQNVSPFAVMAVTFTNKAAREMRGRIEELMATPMGMLWMGTFHGIAHRLLRVHWREAGLPQNFQILDSDDQQRLIRRVIRAMKLDEQNYPPRQLAGFINAAKDEGRRAKHIDPLGDIERVRRDIYLGYEQACRQAGVVDFAELLLRSHELWLEQADILRHYQRRFSHFLVDEFQDTNAIQYGWLRMLCGSDGHMMAVGDDDQSIYRWRGARIENVHRFERDYAPVDVYRLEQNYRSTGNILDAANAVIGHNTGRLGKKLWTESGSGEPISVYSAFNEIDEARFVADRAADWIQKGGSPGEIALLYRSNAQSRVLEEAFLHRDIPYRIHGGVRFFERAEIRDAMSYLRLTVEPSADVAFERVVNSPTRGIGDRTLARVRELARAWDCSLWVATERALTEGAFSGKAASALAGFVRLISELSHALDGRDLPEVMELVLDRTALEAHHGKEPGERGQGKIENLRELVTAARQFTPELRFPLDPEGEERPAQAIRDVILEFLAHATLEAGEAQADAHSSATQLMTMHAAKGLEFPLVFVVGLDEGVFPHRMSDSDPDQLEEERRLCYVAITRAMSSLYLTYAEIRRLHGMEQRSRPSRFIREIPPRLLQEVRVRNSIQRPASRVFGGAAGGLRGGMRGGGGVDYTDAGLGVRIGQRVRHRRYGEGVVLGCEGAGERAHVQVNFAEAGVKWFLGAEHLETIE